MDQITSISLFVLAFALCLPLISYLLAHRPKILSAAKYAILAVYVLANLYETILFRTIRPEMTAEWVPFWSYREAMSFTGGPFAAIKALVNSGFQEGIVITDSELFEEIILNILLYVPLGYLLPFTWPKLLKNRQDRYSPWKVLLIGFGCSALTESTQLIFRIGFFEIDDMINNTLGCLLGWFLYLLIQRGSRTGEQK